MRRERVERVHPGPVDLGDPGQRAQRQAVARGAVAGRQEQLAATGAPALGCPEEAPAGAVARLLGLHRQHHAHGLAEAPVEDARQPLALHRVVELVVDRVEVLGQLGLAQQERRGVLVGGFGGDGVDVERLADRLGQLAGLLEAGARGGLGGDQLGLLPQRLAVLAPVEAEGPAGELLARIPLALAVVQQALGGEAGAQAADQLVGVDALGGADGGLVPLRRVAVVFGHESRLAAHGQGDAVGGQTLVHLKAGGVDRGPGLVGERVGDARLLADARDFHVEVELDVLGRLVPARDRRGRAGRGRGRQGNVPLGGEEARSGVEADPPRAGHVDLAPRMQVGEVGVGAGGAVDGLNVRRQLDQVARDEARRQAPAAHQVHQQPGAVAAGARADLERLLGILHAGLHPDQIGDGVLHGLVDGHEEIDRVLLLFGEGVEDLVEQGALGAGLEVGGQVLAVLGRVVEGDRAGVVLDEEVERVHRGHVGDEIDLHLEVVDLLGEDQTGEPVAERVLLPVDEMRLGRDLLGVAEDLGARVGRGTQADHLGAHGDGLVVAIGGAVGDRRVDAHSMRPWSGCAHRRRVRSAAYSGDDS